MTAPIRSIRRPHLPPPWARGDRRRGRGREDRPLAAVPLHRRAVGRAARCPTLPWAQGRANSSPPPIDFHGPPPCAVSLVRPSFACCRLPWPSSCLPRARTRPRPRKKIRAPCARCAWCRGQSLRCAVFRRNPRTSRSRARLHGRRAHPVARDRSRRHRRQGRSAVPPGSDRRRVECQRLAQPGRFGAQPVRTGEERLRALLATLVDAIRLALGTRQGAHEPADRAGSPARGAGQQRRGAPTRRTTRRCVRPRRRRGHEHRSRIGPGRLRRPGRRARRRTTANAKSSSAFPNRAWTNCATRARSPSNSGPTRDIATPAACANSRRTPTPSPAPISAKITVVGADAAVRLGMTGETARRAADQGHAAPPAAHRDLRPERQAARVDRRSEDLARRSCARCRSRMREDDSVLVSRGLRDGEIVVTAGVNLLHAGQKVRRWDVAAREGFQPLARGRSRTSSSCCS